MTPQLCLPCGEPATERLSIRFRYPRAEPVPEAMDPYYVHGGGGFRSCGSPACEAQMLLTTRTDMIIAVRQFSGRELAERELEAVVVRPQDLTYAEQADGTMHESWPSTPREAI